VNDELERTWKEAVVAQFKALSRNSHGGNEENHDSRSPGRNLNPGHPEYEAGVTQSCLQHEWNNGVRSLLRLGSNWCSSDMRGAAWKTPLEYQCTPQSTTFQSCAEERYLFSLFGKQNQVHKCNLWAECQAHEHEFKWHKFVAIQDLTPLSSGNPTWLNLYLDVSGF
jgi:hypothetical protein